MRLFTLPKDHKILHTPSARVQNFSIKLQTFCSELYDFMIENGGVGISAIQVGVAQQIMCIDVGYAGNLASIIINPKIIKRSAETVELPEGCLSIPAVQSTMTRFAEITVKFQDLSGQEQQVVFTGMAAVIFQHEYDHLKGRMMTDED